ncbi:MAG: UDP-N-acetylmuramoyl-tripeptide--D-alanyl-D-alanine ligase [Actinomycetaceae bacterium]|nr:UDP-N-acetylmuramoyl-tripeptide--D-alanyl-D-alanine ligase [Actinomycetaceae bacterium]MDU0970038.1 UDP-N-acetylmuramoyl-tripeptide--D-alanyl-D-alanine ligase [Actinomycetaceae bacterium]
METRWTLAEVAQAVDGKLVGTDAPITGSVVTDSREVADGSLYVARRGEHADGHRFLGSARAAGAAGAIVTDAEAARAAGLPAVVVADATVALGLLAKYHVRRLREAGPLEVVGITGSAGKTTTKDLLRQVLQTVAPTVAPKLSYNNEVGLPLTALAAGAQTRYLVLEEGASGPGHIAYLTALIPLDFAVELMVGQAHLGGFGSVEALAAAKAELVEGLLPTGCAILNADDPRVMAMASKAPRVTTFGRAPGADVRADNVTLDAWRPRFDLVIGGKSAPVALTLVGAHHVANALAAAAAAHALGMDVDQIAQALSEARALSPHRMAVSDLSGDVVLIDDSYNANPDSLRAGLDALAGIAAPRPGHTIAVIGEMLELGPTSDDLHAECGAYAKALGVDHVVTLGEGARPFGAAFGDATPARDVDDAVAIVAGLVRPGDTILVKGSNSSGAFRVADALVSSSSSKEQSL